MVDVITLFGEMTQTSAFVNEKRGPVERENLQRSEVEFDSYQNATA